MENSEQFCLKWKNHQSTLISQFDSLLEKEIFVDCTLAAEGKYLRAHKIILSACSPYFESLLRLQYDKHPVFILKDVKYQELKAIMNYMYRGQVNIRFDQVEAFLKAAEMLQIRGLSNSGTNKENQRVTSSPLPVSTKSFSPTISEPIVELPPRDDDVADQNTPANRETSSNPTSRKRRKSRRYSNDVSSVLPDNHELSHLSSYTKFVSHLNERSINRTNVTDMTEYSLDVFQSPSKELNVPIITEVRTLESSELILQPTSEYADARCNDYIIDLTLDDDDMDDMVQSQAGPSHGGEGSSQDFAGWYNIGEGRTQDEVFMAAQDAAAEHRDQSQAGPSHGGEGSRRGFAGWQNAAADHRNSPDLLIVGSIGSSLITKNISIDQGGYKSDPPFFQYDIEDTASYQSGSPTFQYDIEDTAGLGFEMDLEYYATPAIEYGEVDERVIRKKLNKPKKSNGPTGIKKF